MAPKINKRQEGLKELASMIADAYRRRATGEIVSPLSASDRDNASPIDEGEILVSIEAADSGTGFVYTETVGVDNFIRNKGRHSNHEK